MIGKFYFYKLFESLPEGIRPIGRPKARLKDQVHKDMRKLGLEEEDTRDRERWRRNVRAMTVSLQANTLNLNSSPITTVLKRHGYTFNQTNKNCKYVPLVSCMTV